ncbi:MAG: LysR family transcriptional regulator [Deltaproteobacteria bacterium]|nr:LysR family transcriptional regulator [Deltaproteobacteria bacterium]
MELNLFSLKIFMKVVECDGISAAAKVFLLSQPAVTMQIQNLENYLAVPLFLRKPNGKLVLTEAGKTLYAFSEKMVDLSNDLLLSMEKYANSPLSEMRLGFCFVAGRYLAPLMLGAFREKAQNSRVTLTVTRAQNIFEGIAGGKLDLGIVGREYKKQLFSGTPLLQVPLTLFKSKEKNDGPLKLSLKELRTLPLIAREEGAGCRLQFQEFLNKKKEKIYNFEIFAESESIEAIKNLVKSGYGFAVLPEFMVKKELEDGLFSEIRLHEGQPLQTFYVFHRKGQRLSRTHQEFLDCILESSDQLQNALLISNHADSIGSAVLYPLIP